MKWTPSPRAQCLLLAAGTTYHDSYGEEQRAIGTGIIPVVGTARSGKTVLGLSCMEWAVANTDRDLAFIGMPDEYLEALPKRMRDRSTNPSIGMLSSLRDCIVLLDDTAVTINARDSQQTRSKMLNRLAGVISHLGLTLILTTQSMAGVDVSLLRFTEMAPLVKRIDPMALRVERSEWSEVLTEAQHNLRRVGHGPEYYYSLGDEMLCKSNFPKWVQADILSRPFRYLPQNRLDSMIAGRTPKEVKSDGEKES